MNLLNQTSRNGYLKRKEHGCFILNDANEQEKDLRRIVDSGRIYMGKE